jgi:hypothetical protein
MRSNIAGRIVTAFFAIGGGYRPPLQLLAEVFKYHFRQFN